MGEIDEETVVAVREVVIFLYELFEFDWDMFDEGLSRVEVCMLVQSNVFGFMVNLYGGVIVIMVDVVCVMVVACFSGFDFFKELLVIVDMYVCYFGWVKMEMVVVWVEVVCKGW